MKSLDFDPYIYECWEVKNSKDETDLLESVEFAILDLIHAISAGTITREDGFIRNQIRKFEELGKYWFDIKNDVQKEYPYNEKDCVIL